MMVRVEVSFWVADEDAKTLVGEGAVTVPVKRNKKMGVEVGGNGRSLLTTSGADLNGYVRSALLNAGWTFEEK